jgi:hypothetical protein
MTVKSMNRRELVLKALRSARRGKLMVNGTKVKTTAGWVDGQILTHEEIGSVQGLRRLRELRTSGVAIEKRFNADTGKHQYRLAK